LDSLESLIKKKYFFDKKNNFFNLEISFICFQFPLIKKNIKLNDKIGTLDLETYGSNLGLGYHQVYAGG